MHGRVVNISSSPMMVVGEGDILAEWCIVERVVACGRRQKQGKGKKTRKEGGDIFEKGGFFFERGSLNITMLGKVIFLKQMAERKSLEFNNEDDNLEERYRVVLGCTVDICQ
uniref:Uncharacterized protein n=1 Tax=Vitis vinifera TaxID=29760 RepID=A5BCK4_VITVI|nr:hypothetical protein VITISV_022378 [Vitis vinifera]